VDKSAGSDDEVGDDQDEDERAEDGEDSADDAVEQDESGQVVWFAVPPLEWAVCCLDVPGRSATIVGGQGRPNDDEQQWEPQSKPRSRHVIQYRDARPQFAAAFAACVTARSP
jgi:hypothetical protein